MCADDIEHSLERELVEIISKIWGTEEMFKILVIIRWAGGKMVPKNSTLT